MPRFEKLSQAEIEKLRRRPQATIDLTPYYGHLESLRAGDWGRVILDHGDSQRAVKRRLTTAAKQKGIGIKYKRSKQGEILFERR